jgi:small ligand-binding sensory domain FIST
MPALSQLKKVFDELPNREKQLFQRGLHVGRVVSEYRESFEAGDFLVRNVLGIDPRNGSIVAGDFFRPGQTVQFHLRDHETADDDLKQLLRALANDSGVEPAGALLFTCNGRGTHLFPQPDHDAQCVARALGPIPAAGFFAAGELGPVGDANFMHGFTASIAVFTNPRAAQAGL